MEKKKMINSGLDLKQFKTLLFLGICFLAFSSASLLLADNYYPPRISYAEGGVSYESAGDVDWTSASVNLPIFRGDRLYTRPGARSEIEFGYNSFLRMDEDTDVVFTHLSERAVSLNLTLGSIIIRSGKSFRIDVQTRLGMIKLDHEGLYRIDTDENGLTRIMVRKGDAEIVDSRDKFRVREGQMTTIGGDPTLKEAAYDNYEDDFDIWSGRRDALYVSSRSVEYIGSYHPGIYALDSYGYWRTYPSLGRVWIPRVSAGWTPYRSGLWLDFSVGWTWLSYEPWGWIPYHYGYWHYYEPYGHWVWAPGFYGSYNRFGPWSPHCVNFFYGGGYVGWAPRPWGHGSRPNNTIINNNTVIVNNNNGINSSRGMTVVKANDFSRRRVETVMVNNLDSNLRRNLKAGLPENLASTGRNSLAAASSKASGRSASASNIRTGTVARDRSIDSSFARETSSRSRDQNYKGSRGSAGTAGRDSITVGTRRNVAPTGNDRSSLSRENGRSPNSNNPEGRVRSIPSRTDYSSGSPAPNRSSNDPGSFTRDRTPGSTPGSRPSGDSTRGNRLETDRGNTFNRVRPIPTNERYSRGFGSSNQPSSNSGVRSIPNESRIRSLTGSNTSPRISNDVARANSTAAKTYRDRSSQTSFWGKVFGSFSSSRRDSGSNSSYTRSRSSGSPQGYSRPSSSSRPSSVSRPSNASRPSFSRPSSVSRPSSRPSAPASRPRRPN